MRGTCWWSQADVSGRIIAALADPFNDRFSIDLFLTGHGFIRTGYN